MTVHNDGKITGNLNANLILSNPSSTNFLLGGERIPLGVALGQDLSIYHDPSNDHSKMRELVGETASSAPITRKAITFEAEWDGDGELPANAKLIRNIGDCPERLVKKIREH